MTRRTLLLVLAATSATACVDNRATIEIRGHAFPGSFAPCTFSPTGQLQLGPGVIDSSVLAAPTYGAVLYVHNGLLNTTASAPGTIASSNAWRALAARVRVNPSDYLDDFPPSPALIPLAATMRHPLDGQTIDPNGDSAQFVDILSPDVGAALRNAYVASAFTTYRFVVGVKIEGETLSGNKLDTGEWFYTIDFCQSCLAAAAAACGTAGGAFSTCFGGWQDPVSCE